ncbi:MAG: PD-(D/E)XK motif protein [Bacteroidaceae bacterium]|nr:PD-(D/E)XK motif protein [Bacteroidaceae bacterium]
MMIDISNILSRIHAIPQDSTLYLIEKLPSGTGLFVSNGNVLYLVPNQEGCASLSIKTDFLHLETNVFVSAFNASISSFENGCYNIVELQMSDSKETEVNLSAFVNLCFSHASYMHGQEFMQFFDSLVTLFQLPREQSYKNLIGLVGELMLIEYIFANNSFDLSPYWHVAGSTSRLDFECPFANFEVKTTAGNSSLFTIKHDQLFSATEKNYLIAIVLEVSNTGRTLEEIISGLFNSPDYCNGIQFSINLEKEKRRISWIDSKQKRFVLRKIFIYAASDINPFKEIPDNIEQLSYKINIQSLKPVTFMDVLKK